MNVWVVWDFDSSRLISSVVSEDYAASNAEEYTNSNYFFADLVTESKEYHNENTLMLVREILTDAIDRISGRWHSFPREDVMGDYWVLLEGSSRPIVVTELAAVYGASHWPKSIYFCARLVME